MPAPHPRTHADYDRLYYRLELEPGASAADIKHNYRQLAQIFHPDKWRHPTAASLHWADEQFKKIKEAREVLEGYWLAHHEAPASRAALSEPQLARALDQVRDLQLRRERLRGELDALQSEQARGVAELTRMQAERERLASELVHLRDEVARARASEAARREMELAQQRSRERAAEAQRERDEAEAASASEAASQAASDAASHATRDAAMAAGPWPPARHALRDACFARLDDPSRGWLITLSGIVVALIVLFVATHRIVFSVFDATGGWRWLGDTLQAVLIAAGVVFAGGFAWAQRGFYRADRAGRAHNVALPAHETWQRVNAALRGTGRYGASWRIESCTVSPGDAGFDLRAVLSYSTKADADSQTNQTLRFHCRAQQTGEGGEGGVGGVRETRLAWGFTVEAPTWWLVPAAKIVRDLRRRVEAELAARV
ncbi:DnaJ-like protein [Paraburkholderia tropica]|uniref:J domain-containing protein n=1 Tax=Paraburkholderia tropica TaxID=92647 RepID=UPI001CAE574B|nr:J domain-containing protein [Paraburkholderia tropica]CAG9216277.1 DnaJ-like protein [Paraburkholderia tropica]